MPGEELPCPLLPGAVHQLPGGAPLHDDPLVHKDGLVGHVPGEGHLVGDDDHGGLLLRQLPDDLQHLPGELRVQGGGGLVEAENVRFQGQGPGDGHPLLLAAGELVGVVPLPVRQPHLCQQCPALLLQGPQDLLFPGFEAGLLPLQQLPGQGDVLQGGVLGKQVEGLKHQPEVEPLFPHLALPLGGGVGGVKKRLAVDDDLSLVGGLQKVQAPQQGGLAGAGGADDGQGLAPLQVKADVPEHGDLSKLLLDALHL